MTNQTIEWGVLVRLPNAAEDVEGFGRHRSTAMNAASNINRRVPGAAKLVYRTVELGEWQTLVRGDDWGVQSTWPDGHIEVEACGSRERAEALARNPNGDPVRTAVSRTKRVGDWWLAEVPA
jgi:hypothetical protein